jgi:hypothetical protein
VVSAAASVAAMAKLIYASIASLDGYIEDAEGNLDRAAPPTGLR